MGFKIGLFGDALVDGLTYEIGTPRANMVGFHARHKFASMGPRSINHACKKGEQANRGPALGRCLTLQ